MNSSPGTQPDEGPFNSPGVEIPEGFNHGAGPLKSKIVACCPNCGQAKPDSDAFCRHCGQRHTRLSDGLGYFVVDFFTSFLSVDGRAFRTLYHLLMKPGQIAVDFMDGKRVRYLSSAQTFLVSGFLFFFILGMWVKVPEIDEKFLQVQTGPDGKNQIAWGKSMPQTTTLKPEIEEAVKTSEDSESPKPEPRETPIDNNSVDHPTEKSVDDLVADAQTSEEDFFQKDRQFYINGQTFRMSLAQFREFATMSESSVAKFFSDQGVSLEPWMVRGLRKGALMTTDYGLAGYVSNSIAVMSQIALFMLPALAVLIRVFFWRSCRNWLMAFIISAQLHSTLYLVLAGLMLSGISVGWLYLLGHLAMLVYWPLTFRRAFHENWFWIIVKLGFIWPTYMGCLISAVLVALASALFLF